MHDPRAYIFALKPPGLQQLLDHVLGKRHDRLRHVSREHHAKAPGLIVKTHILDEFAV